MSVVDLHRYLPLESCTMIPKMLKSVRQRVLANRDKLPQSQVWVEPLQVEPLEQRVLLAFVGFFDGITLDLVQTADDGDVTVDNSGLGGAFRTIDNADTLTFVDAENVTVTLLDNTANQLNFNIDTEHTGDVQLNLGDGPREVFFSGSLNIIGRDLEVNGGDGPQVINLAPIVAPVIPHVTQGSATFNLGQGFDTVYNNENFVTIGGDLSMTGVNLFQYTDFLPPPIGPLDAILVVGGDLTMDTSNESLESFLLEGGTMHDLDPANNARTVINGNFTYIGGDDIDHVDLNETYVVGDVTIDLGEGIPFFGNPQNITSVDTSRFDGNISITAGDSNLGNVVELDGTFNGDTVTFNMGDKVDEITYSLGGAQADVTAFMGAGDDIFTLNAPVNVLDIDFGNDSGDEFINNLGQFTFDSDITNFHWFDHLYTLGDDTMRLVQLMDTSDITIDNDGGPGAFGIAWRLFTGIGGATSTTPARNLELTMISDTGNNVEMDLFNPVIASITMNLGDGDRDVDFTGSSNNPLRDIVINAGLGEQNVALSVNAPLAVATLDIDLGAGFDRVDDDANNLFISENLVFTGVNHFENDGALSVTSQATIDVSGEAEDTIFANNGIMFVGIDFEYLGGGGRDEVRLNGPGGTSITGSALVDLGGNNGAGTQSALLDSALTSVGGTLTIGSSGASGPDVFALDAGSTIGGDISVDLGDGTNDATIVGVFGGANVNYVGGSGVDTVTFGTTGNPADVTVSLGAGDDTFNLLAGASISPDTLIVDFGGGADTFNNFYGLFDFDAQLLNLNGFSHVYDLTADSLTSTQVSALGPVTVDNNGPSNSIRFLEAGTQVVTSATHLTVNMLDGSGTDLSVDFDSPFAGDLTVNLGDGARDFNLIGKDNSIGGDLRVTAGSGAQTVELAVNNLLTVGGNATISLGSDSDSVDEDGNDINIAGSLDFNGVNAFENNGTMTIGGGVIVDNSGETEDSIFDDDATMSIGGGFTYRGGDGRDEVTLNGVLGGTSIAGNASIDLADNVTGGTQFVFLNLPGSSVGGSLTVVSTSAVNTDSFSGHAGASFGGDIDIDLGDGRNDANIVGVFGGSSVSYAGGSGVDLITFGTTGSQADVSANLGTGDDTFNLLAGSSISPNSLFIDFGGGADSFNNSYGPFDFNAQLLNLNGFNHNYSFPAGNLTSTQVSASGPVTVDNNGASNAIRFIDGGITELAPVTDLTINMLNGSGTDLNVSLDNALAGDLTVNLGEGTRALNLDGTDNTIGGDLWITGGSGAQAVEIAVNSSLTVVGDATLNLGSGNDSVDEDGNDVAISGHLDLVGINFLENDGTMAVGGEVTIDNSGENEASLFSDNATMTIFGAFTYTGGGGADEVMLNGTAGGTSIGGNVLIDLGGNDGAGTQSALLDSSTSSVGGTLTVLSTGSSGPDSFATDAGTSIGGDIDVNLGDGPNDATILGVFGGSSVKYFGGTGADDVTFGTTGNPADVNIRLDGGDDTFTLEAGAAITPTTLRVDFGGGADAFVNNFGPFTFDANLLNLDGFNRFYEHAASSLRMTQVLDTGDITVDNNGAGGAIRLLNGFVTEMTPADNVRVNLLANTSTNVSVDYDLPQAGDTILNIKNGDRSIDFIGDSNQIGGFLRIEAGRVGVQDVSLAVNADLSVGESVVVNLREGQDSVIDGGNSVFVGTNLILRAVNTVDFTNQLNVGGNLTMNTTFDNESSILNAGGSILGGNFSYFGGSGADNLLMNGASILGAVYARVANGSASQTIDFSGATLGRLQLATEGATGGNHVITDAATTVAGDVVINLGGGSISTTTLLGTYGGTYGTFRGGTGKDSVVFGATASNMNFVSRMGDGDDTLTLQVTTDLSQSLLDFGPGNDTFVDELGQPYPFPLKLVNLV